MHHPRQSKCPLRRYAAMAALLLAATARAGLAVEIHQLDVTRQPDGYRLLAESSVAAPREYLHAVLSDFDHFYRLAGGITETRFIDDAATGERLGYTRIDSCVWFFCRTIERVERIESEAPALFRTRAIAARSDFERYESEWRLVDEGNGTRIVFSAAMQPDFWVPPVIGSWAIRSKLEETALQMGRTIEQLYADGLALADIPGD